MEKIKIEMVNNGWILYYNDYWLNEKEEHELKEYKKVFGYDDDEENKLDALRSLYFEINDIIGEPYSKHNERNIVIDIEETN